MNIHEYLFYVFSVGSSKASSLRAKFEGLAKVEEEEARKRAEEERKKRAVQEQKEKEMAKRDEEVCFLLHLVSSL